MRALLALAFVLQMPYLPKSRSGPAHAGSSPGRAQRVQDTRRTAAGALDHGHPARIRPAMLPPIHARAPAAGTRCRFDQRAQGGPQRPGGCCPSSRPGPRWKLPRTCAARPGRAVRSCRSPGSRAPGPGSPATLPILTPLLRKSEHPARGTRRAPGARKAPDVLLYSLPR